MNEFRSAVIQSLLDRFTNDKEKGEAVYNKTTNKRRNIITIDIFSSVPFILAALLDPRIKDLPFLGKHFF